MRKLLSLALALSIVLCFAGCSQNPQESTSTADTKTGLVDIKSDYPDAKIIKLDGDKASVDDSAIAEFDYTWHCDPSVAHDAVKDAPAEYYTGTKPETDAAVYIDHELYYYPLLDESGFKLQNYDGEKEWTYYYTDGEHNDYIFATLPSLGKSLPTQMMNSEDEAAKNKVLHITQAGTYALSGKWNGQIMVDLGDEDEAFTNPDAKVTLLLNGADIKCTVAPAVMFKSVYECDNTWEEQDEHSADVNLSNAGANVVLIDGTTNSADGKNVYRMLKTKYKDDDSDDKIKVQKKMRKTDAAFYSYVSMNIGGKGTLNITSNFEGLDTELHLALNDGNITINSQDDGINVNEDNVSVVQINGGNITLNAALGAEGDGIDSNGFSTINGGTLNINGITAPDSAIDSEDGIHYNAGKVFIDGKEQSYTAGDVFRETGRTGGFGGIGGDKDFGQRPDMLNDADFDLQKFKQDVAALEDDATMQDVLALLGMDNFRGEKPDNIELPENIPDPPEKPEN